jgi:hypothetical protein
VDLTSTSRIPEELNFAHEMGIVAPGDQIKIHRGFNGEQYLFAFNNDDFTFLSPIILPGNKI